MKVCRPINADILQLEIKEDDHNTPTLTTTPHSNSTRDSNGNGVSNIINNSSRVLLVFLHPNTIQ